MSGEGRGGGAYRNGIDKSAADWDALVNKEFDSVEKGVFGWVGALGEAFVDDGWCHGVR